MAGTVGAMFNGALQLGSAIGMAAVTSIETSVERVHGGFYEYNGRAAAFWFLLGVLALQATAVSVFYRIPKSVSHNDIAEGREATPESDMKEEKSVTAQTSVAELGY